MNKRQKKKKGLLLIEKVYSNYGKKKNESPEKKVVKEVKEKKVVEEVKEETPVEEVKEEKEVKEEDK